VRVFWDDGGPWRNVAVYDSVCVVVLGLGLGLLWEEVVLREKVKGERV
jgi:hypothetical protein